MKKIFFRLLLVITILAAVFTNLYISAGVNADAGALSVTNGPVVISIAPGATSHYVVTVTNAFAMDLEVDGLGENADRYKRKKWSWGQDAGMAQQNAEAPHLE